MGSLEGIVTAYYGKDMNSRAADFLSWLKENQGELQKQFKKDIRNGRIQLEPKNEKETVGAVGYWLGTRYIASKCKISEKQEFPPFRPAGEGDIDRFSIKPKIFIIDMRKFEKMPQLSAADALIRGINIGIHEGTHALPFINGMDTGTALSEIAAYYNQTAYGLPIKDQSIETASGFDLYYNSVRDFASRYEKTIKDEKAAGKLGGEYLSFVIGPWIKKFFLDKKVAFNVFDFQKLVYSSETYPSGVFYSGPIIGRDTPEENNLKNMKFFESAGIGDNGIQKELREALSRVFDKTRKELEERKIDLDTMRESPQVIYPVLIKYLDEEFGKPVKENIPEGYSYLAPFKRGKLDLESVPKKLLG